MATPPLRPRTGRLDTSGCRRLIGLDSDRQTRSCAGGSYHLGGAMSRFAPHALQTRISALFRCASRSSRGIAKPATATALDLADDAEIELHGNPGVLGAVPRVGRGGSDVEQREQSKRPLP